MTIFKVSVLMAAYNEQVSVKRAVKSIIGQTFSDWEFVIIDDCSTDQTKNLLQEFVQIYPDKVRVYRNNKNLGLAASLNRGINLCRGQYIARMDADDWSYPERLERQINFMENHLDVDVLGTGAALIGPDDKIQNIIYLSETHDEIEKIALKKTIFFHPSVMIKKSFFTSTGKYNENLLRGQDLELWIRGLRAGSIYHNLQKPLIRYTTNGYVRSYKIIAEKFYASFYICLYHRYYSRIFHVFIRLLKSLFVKIGWYTPQAIR